jgi:hypothetical protein
MIQVGAPPADTKAAKAPQKLPVEDRVRDALELIDSGHKSDVEWIMIRKLYDKLCTMRASPRIKNLKQMIEPVLSKYGYHCGSEDEK